MVAVSGLNQVNFINLEDGNIELQVVIEEFITTVEINNMYTVFGTSDGKVIL